MTPPPNLPEGATGPYTTPPTEVPVHNASTVDPSSPSDPFATQHFDKATTPPTSWPKIPGYEILGELGRGGMGVVYKARQEKVNRFVALKMVLNSGFASPEARIRFLLEGEVLGRLQHPHIVQIYEVDTFDGQPYFALEYVEGGSLADLRKKQTFTPTAAATLVEQLARAMHFAHSNGVIHRDLKPANILMASVGASARRADSAETDARRADAPTLAPKVTDFGLAKQTEAGAGMTASGAIMGTPAYMAPEQAEGKIKQITAATDVYALGAILYELLSGRPPFVADTPFDVIRKVMHEEPSAINSLCEKLPQDLATICHKCLQKEPAKRYTTAEALADDLRRFLEDRPILARPVTTGEKVWRWCRRNPVVAGMGTLAFLSMLVATIIAWVFAMDAQEKERIAVGEKETARKEKERADQEKDRATKERNEAHRLNVLQAVREGLKSVDQGDLFTALLWFAQPLVRDPDNHETAQTARNRIAAYRQHVPAPTLCHMFMHQDIVTYAAFSPNGRWVVTASFDKTAQVWDTVTGQPRFRPLVHQDKVWCAAFSPDGRRIVTASVDKTARIWDVTTGHRCTLSLVHQHDVRHAAFSPDGRWVVTTSGREARVWDAATGQPLTPPLVHQDAIWHAAFSTDGRWVVTASHDKTARVWDALTGLPRTPPLVHQKSVYYAAFSPDNRWVVTASGREARVWDAATGKSRTSFLTQKGGVMLATFSPNGRWVVTASNPTWVWDVVTGQPRTPPLIHQNDVSHAAFSPDSRWVLTCSLDKTVRVWDSLTGQPRTPPLVHQTEWCYAAFSPDNRWVVTVSGRGARVWDIASGQQSAPPLAHQGWIHNAEFSPDGRWVVKTVGREAQVWDVATGQRRIPPLVHQDKVRHAKFSPDGRWVVTASDDKTARVWDAATGQPRTPPLVHQKASGHVAFSPDSRWIVTVSDQEAQVWDASTGQPRASPLTHQGWIHRAVFSPDGRKVVTASIDKTARVWDVATSQPCTPPLLHQDMVSDATFSPDGRWIVTVSIDKAARVWDAATGLPQSPPLMHKDNVIHAIFSPDGRWIVTTSYDKTARTWLLPEEERPKADLLLLTQLLSGHSVDDTGTVVPLSAEEFLKAWQTLHTKYPNDFRVAPAVARQWRQEQIAECLKSGNLPGAFLHRDWLLVEAIREQAKAEK